MVEVLTFLSNSVPTNTPPVFLNSEKHKVKIWQSQTTAAKYKGLFEGVRLYRLRYLFVIENSWLGYHTFCQIVYLQTPPVFLDSEKHEVKIWQSQTTAAKYKGVLHQCAFESPKHSFLSSTSVPHNVSHLAQDHMFATPHLVEIIS